MRTLFNLEICLCAHNLVLVLRNLSTFGERWQLQRLGWVNWAAIWAQQWASAGRKVRSNCSIVLSVRQETWMLQYRTNTKVSFWLRLCPCGQIVAKQKITPPSIGWKFVKVNICEGCIPSTVELRASMYNTLTEKTTRYAPRTITANNKSPSARNRYWRWFCWWQLDLPSMGLNWIQCGIIPQYLWLCLIDRLLRWQSIVSNQLTSSREQYARQYTF